MLRARGLLARREFSTARRLLDEAIARWPQAIGPRVILTHVLLQEGGDAPAAERALRDVLALDSRQAESWRNLAVLRRRHGDPSAAAAVCAEGLRCCPDDAELLLQLGMTYRDFGQADAAEDCLLRVLEASPGASGDGWAAPREVSARHQLALLYRDQGRQAEAEAQGRAAVGSRDLGRGTGSR